MSLIVVCKDDLAPKWECYVCGGTFHTLGVFQRHVVKCSDEHEEELRQLSWRTKNPHLFDPNVAGDVEFGRWVRQHSKAILEGRVRM